MGRAAVSLLICSLVVACGGGGLIGSAAAATPQTLSVLEVDTSLAGTGGYNLASKTLPAPGQGITFSGTLYRWAGPGRGVRLGHVEALCTRTTGADAICSGVISLPAGTLELLGPTNFASSASSDIAIVGGTRAYAGAEGYMHTVNIGGAASARSADTFHIVN